VSAPWRKILQEVRDLSDHKILLMVSGGADSMFLLDLCKNAGLQNFDVLHFQHGIRDNDHLDRELIEKYITDKDIKCNFVVDHGQGLKNIPNQEAEARTQRWGFVRQHTERLDLDPSRKVYVLTGHHLNDNIEQVFLDTMHGNKHNNLGMRKESYHPGKLGNFTIYRLLLRIPKSVILRQCTLRNIPYINDITNDDTHHERNWLRNVIIPQLMERRNLERSMAKSLITDSL